MLSLKYVDVFADVLCSFCLLFVCVCVYQINIFSSVCVRERESWRTILSTQLTQFHFLNVYSSATDTKLSSTMTPLVCNGLDIQSGYIPGVTVFVPSRVGVWMTVFIPLSRPWMSQQSTTWNVALNISSFCSSFSICHSIQDVVLFILHSFYCIFLSLLIFSESFDRKWPNLSCFLSSLSCLLWNSSKTHPYCIYISSF